MPRIPTRRYSIDMGLLTIGLMSVALHGAMPGPSGDDINELRREIDELRADNAQTKQELSALKSQNGEQWLTEQRTADIRGIVQDVLADAETRTSLQDSGATSGWNGKDFVLSSPDGNYTLVFKGQIQVRWTMNSAQDQATEWGFENRRTKLYFEGNIVDPSWNYRVKMAFNPLSRNARLEEAWIRKDLGGLADSLEGATFRVGAFKAPWLREELVSSARQLAVDRSVVTEFFSQGYSKGLELAYATDDWRVTGWYGNGINSRSVNYNEANFRRWDSNDTRWSFAGRFEYKIAGSWGQFRDYSSFRGEDFGVLLGVSAMGQKFRGGTTDPALSYALGSGALQYGITADASIDFGGASLNAAFVWTHNNQAASVAPGAARETFNPWGFTVQGGYFVTEDIELFGRYAYLNYDRSFLPSSSNRYNGITLGMNWFLAGPAVKFSTDWSINLNNFHPTRGSGYPGIGWRPDQLDSDKNQWALRAQLQLLF